jgi:hypothetical protein
LAHTSVPAPRRLTARRAAEAPDDPKVLRHHSQAHNPSTVR